MKPTNRQEVLAFLKHEAVSGIIIAIAIIALLCLTSRAIPGQPCVQRVQKNVKRQTVLVPVSDGYRQRLVELPVEAAFSEIYDYRYALPIRTYEPVQYEPAPPGDGLAQPVLLKRERVIETYANPEVEEVVAEEVQAEPSYPETPEHCEPHATGDCKATNGPRTDGVQPHPGSVVAKENCASCHTGAKAKAANRPVFYDAKGTFIATDAQKQKMLTAARMGTMPPKQALDDDEYLALSSWLKPKVAAKQSVKTKRKVVGIGLDGTSLITQESSQ